MKLTTRLLTGLGTLALASAAFAGTAHASPPPPLTLRTIISFEGNGNTLTSCGASGNTVVFAHNLGGCQYPSWNFQINNNGTYLLHPQNNSGLCMTASTTQEGVIKIEGCVGAVQQDWFDNLSGGHYQIESLYYLENVKDPSESNGGNAGLIANSSYGNNGWTMVQE